jgi:hypothetical protein
MSEEILESIQMLLTEDKDPINTGATPNLHIKADQECEHYRNEKNCIILEQS